MKSWVFGEFMCKMYHFINSMSTTASVLILVVISFERYFAIIHPMTCKQILTPGRLRYQTQTNCINEPLLIYQTEHLYGCS
ncbi:Growth hormone secretagogue receptor type 1 [Orchesella cincta]|uniref:Growth hormone secretagogue receptor type 1 n=1 Tax=Orchesella cincta TaxID=48709 RepID=A0A1D2M5N5_ORCCI|nr:Growth hormone secretagogue receptor type 1 [Orchesella cincta]